MIAAGLCEEFRVERDRAGTVVRLGHALGRPVPLLQSVAEGDGVDRRVEEWDSGLTTDMASGRLVVTGSVDLLAMDAFHDALQEVTRGGTADAVVDLNGVTHLASSAVQSLFDFAQRSRRSDAVLEIVARPGTPAHHILELVDLPYVV